MARTLSTLGRLGSAALDLLYPPRCVGCDRAGAFLCAACAGSLKDAAPPRCSRCWRPNPNTDPCFDCQAAPPAYDGLRSAFVYQGTARALVHALKYRQATVLAQPVASLMAEAARRHGLEVDVLIPVPLSGLRGRIRGYNQAEVLARAVGRELDLPVWPRALARRRHTSPQARAPDAEARRRNVAGAFACRERDVAGRRVLLLDDVTTTGATLADCARALKEADAGTVWGLTFARED